MKTNTIIAAIFGFCILHSAFAFEGRINAIVIQGNRTDALLYTVSTNSLRGEMMATNWPNPVDILDLNSGKLTLLFPNNRSFVRLKPAVENASSSPAGVPARPIGIGPQTPPPPSPPSSIGPINLPGMPAPPAMPQMSVKPNMPQGMAGGMPAMPTIPPPMMEETELTTTGDQTNLLGFTCEKFEIKQRGETMEIWMGLIMQPRTNLASISGSSCATGTGTRDPFANPSC